MFDEPLDEEDEPDEDEDDELVEEDELVEPLPELDDSEAFELDEDESEPPALAAALFLLPDSERLSVR